MKRKIFILVALFMLFGITATAENVGDVIGAVYPTDYYIHIAYNTEHKNTLYAFTQRVLNHFAVYSN